MTADIVGYDRNDQPLLLLNVQVSVGDHEEFEEFRGRFLSRTPAIPYGFYVDLEWIRVMDRSSGTPNVPVVRLDTKETLQFYDPDFRGKNSRYGTKLIFGDYLSTLVDVWLQDLAYHWKSKTPPGSLELEPIDFLRRMEGGMLKRDVVIQVSSADATAGTNWHAS